MDAQLTSKQNCLGSVFEKRVNFKRGKKGKKTRNGVKFKSTKMLNCVIICKTEK